MRTSNASVQFQNGGAWRATCGGCASRSSSRPDRSLFLVECRPILSCTEHVPGSCGGRVIQREEALDAQFLKRDVLWCAEHRDRREPCENAGSAGGVYSSQRTGLNLNPVQCSSGNV